MAFERNLQFINGSKALTFLTPAGFAQNPGSIPAGQPGNAFNAKDFVNIIITMVGTGTVKFHGSAQDTPPDFSVASTLLNTHAPIVSADYSIPNTFYAGATGIVLANETKIVELNTNLLSWFAIERSVGTVDVIVTVADNL